MRKSLRERRWFPQRELIVRANGTCRFITITPAMQVTALALAALFAVASVAGVGSLLHTRQQTAMMHSALIDRAEEVSVEQQRVTAYRAELDAARQRLEQRQAFLERMVEMLPATETKEGADDDAAKPIGPTDAKLSRIGAVIPEARGLAALERRQLASVAALTDYAETRSVRAEQAIRRLGLDPRPLVAATRGTIERGMGGPLEPIATEADGSLDPRFERLGSSLARLTALEQGLARVPQVMPTAHGRMTSNFGYRRDPFTGGAALHSGLDFGGRMGDPIRAAAAGRVTFVGTKAGYGKVVEITHGNGLMTRYAHMSAWRARAGQAVAAGQVIGAIGSTGRSTGPHLHFEVRAGDRAINPRPFLESAADILAEMRS